MSSVRATSVLTQLPTYRFVALSDERGLNWTIAQTGDYNGDGKSDVLWTDNTGNFGVWLMNGTSVSSTQNYGKIGTNWQVQSLNAE